MIWNILQDSLEEISLITYCLSVIFPPFPPPPLPAAGRLSLPHFRGRVGRGTLLIFIDNLRILY